MKSFLSTDTPPELVARHFATEGTLLDFEIPQTLGLYLTEMAWDEIECASVDELPIVVRPWCRSVMATVRGHRLA